MTKAYNFNITLPPDLIKWTCPYCANLLIPGYNTTAHIKSKPLKVLKDSLSNTHEPSISAPASNSALAALQHKHKKVYVKYANEVVKQCSTCGNSSVTAGVEKLVRKSAAVISKAETKINITGKKKKRKGGISSVVALAEAEASVSKLTMIPPSAKEVIAAVSAPISSNLSNKPFSFGGASSTTKTPVATTTLLQQMEMSKKRKRVNSGMQKGNSAVESNTAVPTTSLSAFFTSLQGK